MTSLVIIPARMAATRLPDKPLADIAGLPMIVRVMKQAQKASGVRVVVAAGDQAIVDAIVAHGGEAVLTDPALPSGSDQIMAALKAVDPEGRHDIVINLQGDMPFVDPDVISRTVALLNDQPKADIATLVATEHSPADRGNKDVVKAVLTTSGKALYFTRSTLFGDAPIWRHIGIYGYRRAALEAFTAAPPSPLETLEKLEQLRALEMDMNIYALVVEDAPLSVDNPADLDAAIAYAQINGL
ncbi:3-deoxy-manno-octulosonate cytidylyltransferase [Asticcacaulis sp. ZE23SCel15]|uniref:3-deoxy-manno-octulosonate cytidylyltransferase n=1 Tax=Asticcacaulis sp. ZE23SCel15 TaxID=3059027 RepID=UPI00265D8331|nr:3-deoxy-manno-octulosonate cytidylyltransferase [Asticcacaulis sp. ZE23SCel15]WKL57893.1 3-deoxy-manno-octulosonate cytidylyltransferase [Asticcacaulis sp. ZE23SCel15]